MGADVRVDDEQLENERRADDHRHQLRPQVRVTSRERRREERMMQECVLFFSGIEYAGFAMNMNQLRTVTERNSSNGSFCLEHPQNLSKNRTTSIS